MNYILYSYRQNKSILWFFDKIKRYKPYSTRIENVSIPHKIPDIRTCGVNFIGGRYFLTEPFILDKENKYNIIATYARLQHPEIFNKVPGRTKVSDDFLIKLIDTNLIVPGLKT